MCILIQSQEECHKHYMTTLVTNCYRQRWRQENEVLGPVSFTNPNYSRSSCDAISIGTRVRPWRLFKFDRNEVGFMNWYRNLISG